MTVIHLHKAALVRDIRLPRLFRGDRVFDHATQAHGVVIALQANLHGDPEYYLIAQHIGRMWRRRWQLTPTPSSATDPGAPPEAGSAPPPRLIASNQPPDGGPEAA